MTQPRFGEQACCRVRERLDSYIDNELLTETNLDLIEHLQRCKSCALELQARQNLRARLQTAARGVLVPPGLEQRIRGRLRQTRQPPARKFQLTAIAATLALCVGSWVVYEVVTLRLAVASRESYFERLSGQVATIMRVGLGDHLQCAVAGQRANRSKVAVDNLPGEFKEVIRIVRRKAPAQLPLILAHECRYYGRKFVHLTFRNDRTLLSLVIVRKQEGELLAMANLPPTLSESGIPMYTAAVDQFQVAAFESPDFLVYTVSDLPRQKNLDVLVALGPPLQILLNQLKS